MSKDNMLLGYARGKVGSLVFARRDGQQITRAYNANPANPRSTSQMSQRVLMATAIQAYRSMSVIVDHSFENAVGKVGNMRAFMSAALRDLKANPQNFGFQRWKERAFCVGPYQISNGSLNALPTPSISVTLDNISVGFGDIGGENVLVRDIATLLGLYLVGDMVTIPIIYPSALGGSNMTFVRITFISDPADATITPGHGAPSTYFKVESPQGTVVFNNAVNLSSAGNVYIRVDAAPAWLLSPGADYFHSAAIRSRFQDGAWLRSPATLSMGAGYVAAPTFDDALATYPQNGEPVLNGGQV